MCIYMQQCLVAEVVKAQKEDDLLGGESLQRAARIEYAIKAGDEDCRARARVLRRRATVK